MRTPAEQVRLEIQFELQLLEKPLPRPGWERKIAYVPRSQLENWLRLLGGEPERKP